MKLKAVWALALVTLLALTTEPAYAGDAVTLVFREGQVVYLNYGYKAIAEGFKNLNSNSRSHAVMEFSIEGGSFLLDLSEVVIVCRDRCSSMVIEDPRSKKKGNEAEER